MQTLGPPLIAVSPRMTKIVVAGLEPTNMTKMVYAGKSIDWVRRSVKDINLTPEITGTIN